MNDHASDTAFSEQSTHRKHGMAGISTDILVTAAGEAFKKLDPRTLIRNPVMFVVELVSALTTILVIKSAVAGGASLGFAVQITFWLWFTVIFANFAEAVAEGRGKAQAEDLRRTRTQTMAKRLANAAAQNYQTVPAPDLKQDDIVLVEAGDFIPSDGDVIEGLASVDESAITGESAPVIRESGGDRSAVTGGTRVLSDWIKVRITAAQGSTFLDRMIALVEGAERQKTPNEIALNILLAGMTIIFVIATVTIPSFATYAGGSVPVVVLVALFVTLIPTTIGALLSAIGIAGMDRLVKFNVLAMSGRAVEAAGDVDTLLLDKTGTITLGNRQASEFLPLPGVSAQELADAAQLSSLADETPEGRSIVVLAKDKYGLRAREMASLNAHFVPFTAQTRMSGVDVEGSSIRKGAVDSILAYVRQLGGLRDSRTSEELQEITDRIARRRHAACRREGWPRARRHPSQGHREGRHPRTFRRIAPYGYPHGDDHRRQSAHRCGHRRGSRASMTSSPRRHRRTNSSLSAPSRPRASWLPCAAMEQTTRRRSRRPMSASPCRPARRPRAKQETWWISIPTPPNSSRLC